MDEKKEPRAGTEPRRYPPVLRRVDPDQLPPPLNREQRRRLRRKKRS